MHQGKPVAEHAVATLAAAAALLFRFLLDPFLGDHLPFVTFFVAVVVASWYGGLRPGLLATGLGFLLALYFFVPPRFSLLGTTGPHLVGLAMYFLVSLAIAAFSEATRAAQRRSRADRAVAQEQREWLRTTLASIGDAVITTDAAGKVTLVNGVAQELTGWRQDEALGLPLEAVFKIINEQTRRPVENPVQHVLREGRVVGLANHTVLIGKDGTERPIDDSAAPIRDATGKVVGVVLIFRDITERRRLERQSAERAAAARLLASIVESSGDAIIGKSLDGVIQTWNAGAQRLFGYTAEQAVGRPITLIIPPDRAGEEERILARLRAGERVDPFDTVRVRSDGQPVHVSVTVSPIRDESGGIVGASKIARDVSGRKALEQERRRRAEELAQAEERTRSVVENVIDGIIVIDEHGTVQALNPAAERIFGYGAAEVIGQNVKVLMPEPYRGEHDRYLGNYLRTGEAKVIGVGREVVGRRKDGSLFPMDLAVGEFRLGDRRHFTGVVRDVTERKLAEAALKEADRRKDEFLATLAHELRNPLAPIRNALELMRQAGGDRALLEQTRAIMARQLGHMVRLIDDLLDVSRISRGKIELRRERVELAGVVHSAVEATRPLIDASGHELTVALPAEPISLDADPTRLTQVFSNLLNNASRFTQKGGCIWLTAERRGGEAVVRVRDTGVGIPTEHLPRLFEMFAQVTPALERSQGGLGVGLSLVRGLVQLHGGTVEARSGGPGRGSEFVVRLPVAGAPQQAAREPGGAGTRAPAGPQGRVLVVDDNRDAADSLALMLRLWGHDIRTAYDGAEAVQAAAEFRPGAILLDIGLPKMNGYEVARHVRAQLWGRDVCIIALTGWGQDEDKRRAAEAGCDHHLTKPVDHPSLERLLARELAQPGRGGGPKEGR